MCSCVCVCVCCLKAMTDLERHVFEEVGSTVVFVCLVTAPSIDVYTHSGSVTMPALNANSVSLFFYTIFELIWIKKICLCMCREFMHR